MTSLYELTNSWEKPARTGFVDNISGDALDTNRWGKCNNEGTAVFTMLDEIDGGFRMSTTSGSSTNDAWISFNANSTSGATSPFCQFNPYGSVLIDVMRYSSAKSTISSSGGGFSTEGRGDQATSGYPDSGNHSAAFHYTRSSPDLNFYFITLTDGDSGGGSYGVDSGVAFDTDWHCHKIELLPSSAEYTLDGILKGTRTNNLPRNKQSPVYGCMQLPTQSTSCVLDLKYIEAYNT